jgi:uncharacterized protein YdaU (DUF1376 family)
MGFMPFYYQRFAWSTRGWPAEAALAYIYLLCEQYAAGSLDPNPEVLEEIAPGTVAHWDRIKRKFGVGPDGRLRNQRCEDIRAKSVAEGDRRRHLAQQAAAKRWQGTSSATAMRPHSVGIADAIRIDANDNENENEIETEIQNDQKTHTLGGAEHVPDNSRPKMRMPEGALDRLWALFPRKVGKRKALALLEKEIRAYADEWELPDLTDAVEVFREHIVRMATKYRNTEERFIPHPATWLSQGRYLDPVETP